MRWSMWSNILKTHFHSITTDFLQPLSSSCVPFSTLFPLLSFGLLNFEHTIYKLQFCCFLVLHNRFTRIEHANTSLLLRSITLLQMSIFLTTFLLPGNLTKNSFKGIKLEIYVFVIVIYLQKMGLVWTNFVQTDFYSSANINK